MVAPLRMSEIRVYRYKQPAISFNEPEVRRKVIITLKIILHLKDNERIVPLDWNIDKECINEDFDHDTMLMKICNILYDSKMVIFKIEGFGETWNIANCRSELPCILEQMQYIFQHIGRKESFEIDFYEQGLERILHFSFNDNTIRVSCTSYVNNIPPVSTIVMSYATVKALFLNVYQSFVTCVETLLPNVVKNDIFIEWRNICADSL